jgi:hypothetical protein
MESFKKLILGSVVLAGLLVGAGCSSDPPQMSAGDAANFNGKNAKPMTDEQRKAMTDFQQNFNKLHPPTGGPGVPPPGQSR